MSPEAKPFGTPEQLEAAEKAIQNYAAERSEAFAALKKLWQAHYLEVGHKALGRILLGKTAADLLARKGRAREE